MWKLYGSDQTLVTDLRPVMLVFPHESSPHSPAWRPRSAGLRRNGRTQNQSSPDSGAGTRLRAEPSGSLRPRRHPRHEVPHAAHFGKRYRGRSGRGWRTVRARQARLARAALPRTELPPVRAVPAGQRQLLQIRPAGMPDALGLASENAAHRIAVEWTDAGGVEREGVFIPRRDTGSFLNRVAGGRIFPGEHHPARFSVLDISGHIELSMRSLDGTVSVRVVGDNTDMLPASSCFSSVAEASSFFEGGSLGYSVTRDARRLDGLRSE